MPHSLLALTVAYSLAVQAIMASVGLSMSAPDQGGHVICSFTSGPSAHTPATSGDRQNPGPQPHCPFCFIAAQSAGHIATMGEALAFPAYAGMQIADKFSVHIGDKALVSQYRRKVGEPRAPPTFSVAVPHPPTDKVHALLLEISLRGPAGRHCCSRHRSRNRNSLDCCPATLGTGDPRWRHDRRRLYDTQQ